MLEFHAIVLCALAGAALRPDARASQSADEDGPRAAVHDLVAEGVPAATFHFELRDPDGLPIPGRLTFVGDGGPRAPLFELTDAAPNELAVRHNVVYSRSGTGSITVPAGTYEVWASRGLEWSAPHASLEFEAGGEVSWTATLQHEVDTEGWISGDFHLHTLTYSGHGDANLEERLISLVGEGVEFAVATDHNHHTDYGPTQDALGLGEQVRTVTGNEVSVPVGHFNAFPLEPDRPVAPTDATDANALFAMLRAEPNRFDTPPVVQVNHPRWGQIDYFGQAELDPITRVPGSPAFSYDFDTVEVFNATEGWGYYDADTSERPIGSGVHWVLGDWFSLLNQGRRPAAVGNSDSHTVHFEFAGFPRNFVPSDAATPAEIDVAGVADALRAKRVFTTLGPFVEVSVGGAPMGSVAQAVAGEIVVEIDVRAASWIDCDRIIPVYNGHALDPIPVPDTREVERFWSVFVLPVPRDGWLAFRVEGDDSLAPVVDGGARPILPLAVTNPVWIDADGDGQWTSPWDQAQIAVSSYDSSVALRREVFAPCTPPERALLIRAAAELGRPFVNELVRAGLRDEAREVRLAAARAAEVVGDRSLVDGLELARERPDADLFAKLAFLRSARACGADVAQPLFDLFERYGVAALGRYRSDLDRLMPGAFVQEWMLAGFFPNPEPTTLVTSEYGPELPATRAATAEEWGGWRAATTGESGYVDLLELAEEPGEGDNSIAYAVTWLRAPDDREVKFAFGADDGSRIWVEGLLVYEDNTRHGATPYQHVGTLPLHSGWNRVLVKVENGGGGFGLYLRILDPEIEAARQPVDR